MPFKIFSTGIQPRNLCSTIRFMLHVARVEIALKQIAKGPVCSRGYGNYMQVAALSRGDTSDGYSRIATLPRERGWIPQLKPEQFVLGSNLFNGLSLHCYIFHKNIQGQHQQTHLEPPQSSSDNTRWISGLLLRTKCPKTEIQQTSATLPLLA